MIIYFYHIVQKNSLKKMLLNFKKSVDLLTDMTSLTFQFFFINLFFYHLILNYL